MSSTVPQAGLAAAGDKGDPAFGAGDLLPVASAWLHAGARPQDAGRTHLCRWAPLICARGLSRTWWPRQENKQRPPHVTLAGAPKAPTSAEPLPMTQGPGSALEAHTAHSRASHRRARPPPRPSPAPCPHRPQPCLGQRPRPGSAHALTDRPSAPVPSLRALGRAILWPPSRRAGAERGTGSRWRVPWSHGASRAEGGREVRRASPVCGWTECRPGA